MAAENTHTFSSSISLKMRSILTLCAFIENQNSSNSQTLDEETKLGIIKRIDDLTQQATVIVQAPLKALKEQCFKPPLKKCQKCGKLKIAGRQVLNIVDAVRRFKYFGSQHQQPSETTLVSDSDGYSRIQRKSIAIVQQWQSSQATTMENESQQSEWEDVQGAHQSLSRTNRKTQHQHRKGYCGSKEVGPRRQSYDNSWNDVILAPTLMHCDPEIENLGSSSGSSTGSGSRRSCSSASYSSSYVGSNYQTRSQRTSTSAQYSVYSASEIVSGTSSPIYGESSGSEWKPYSRNGVMDRRGGYKPYSREDRNARTHRPSNNGNPGNNNVVLRRSEEQKVTKNTRRTPVKSKQGHLKKLTGGFFSHFWGSRKSKPSTAEKRRLERTVTGKGKATAKKLDWLENIHKRTKSKGGEPNHKLKKLL